jgi:hypothetical protein
MFFAAKLARQLHPAPPELQMQMKESLLVLLPLAASLALTSCSSTTYGPIDDKSHDATYEKGMPGGTVVETYDVTAKVTDIDPSSRKVSLLAKNGKKATVKCGPEVINFDQIRVGDVVKAIVTSELTVEMANSSTHRIEGANSTFALAPKGAKPGGSVAETQQYTATITAINLKRHQATLRFPDGSKRTFNVRKDVDLTQRKVGEEVTFRVAVAMAISIKEQ